MATTFGAFKSNLVELEEESPDHVLENIEVGFVRGNKDNSVIYDPNKIEYTLLKEEIKANGLMQALTVMRDTSAELSYVVLAGHRRFQVCKELGYKTVPCMIVEARTAKDRLIHQMTAITTNVIRRNSSEVEKSREIKRMYDVLIQIRKIDPDYYKGQLSREIIATQVGLSERQTTRHLNIATNLPASLDKAISDENFTLKEANEAASIFREAPESNPDEVIKSIVAKRAAAKQSEKQSQKGKQPIEYVKDSLKKSKLICSNLEFVTDIDEFEEKELLELSALEEEISKALAKIQQLKSSFVR